MIKVIASDLDDTLLGSNHMISKENADAVKRVQDAGIEFLVCTGRTQEGADIVIKPAGIHCKCVTASGAEINDADGNNIKRYLLSYEQLELLVNELAPYNTHMTFYSKDGIYVLVDGDDLEELILDDIRLFYSGVGTDDEIRQTEVYKAHVKNLTSLESVKEFEKQGIEIFKAFAFSKDVDAINEARACIRKQPSICSASAFKNSIELTDANATKGPVLKDFIESQGYIMDEVMIIGDSPNDRSMFDMDFGIRMAVSSGYQEIKDIATHITKGNDENGVAYALDKLLDGTIDDLKVR